MEEAKLRFLSSIVIILIAVVPAYAIGQGGIEFDMLSTGVGARPLGMGGAFTAVADNADCPFYNPAGLANIYFKEITTTQTKLSTDADHYYISYVQPLGKGSLGISWIQVGTGSLTQTSATVDAYNEVINLNSFSYFTNAYLISYGMKLTKRIAAGLTAKYLSSDMTRQTGGQAHGYSVSPGVLVRPSEIFTLGFKIDELFNNLSWGTGTSEKAPPNLHLGMAVRSNISGLFALDFSQILKSGYTGSISAGYEWEREGLAFRLGYADSAMTAGAGFRSGVAQIDYAYVQQTSLSKDNVHRISLSGRW
ncbi:MAG: PorV/PorQ family protein [Candidatus Saganbacteria bacterium]|nr:PorV/PorQ family protein [Candidatus Saganbacteria bacterium]